MILYYNKNLENNFKLISKLVTKILVNNILNFKLASKRLIEINLKYKVVSS